MKHVFGEGGLVQFTVDLLSYAIPIDGEFDRFDLANYQLDNRPTHVNITLMVQQLAGKVSTSNPRCYLGFVAQAQLLR